MINKTAENPLSNEASEKPLITFALFAYNQEKYIREAIEGAFSQTYSPLEIILSDDASSDGTYQIMRDEAEKYKGPHKIIINKNVCNQGIGGHINKIMSISSAEMIIIAAGDDVSRRDRAQEVYEKWKSCNFATISIHSGWCKIDEHGNKLRVEENRWKEDINDIEKTLKKKAYVLGATHAWHRNVFKFFGPLLEGVTYEDQAIQIRSALIGRVCYINEPLVFHRVGTGITSEYKNFNAKERVFGVSNDRWLVARAQQLKDLKIYGRNKSLIDVAQHLYDEHLFLKNISTAEATSEIIFLAVRSINKPIPVSRILTYLLIFFQPSLYDALLRVRRATNLRIKK